MKIKLEKILTVSAYEYAQSVGKPLSAYEMQGVYVKSYPEIDAPEGTEVIVSYKLNPNSISYGFGTALIPRNYNQESRISSDQNPDSTKQRNPVGYKMKGERK